MTFDLDFEFDMMKYWGSDISYKQGGPLAGPQKWNPLLIQFQQIT